MTGFLTPRAAPARNTPSTLEDQHGIRRIRPARRYRSRIRCRSAMRRRRMRHSSLAWHGRTMRPAARGERAGRGGLWPLALRRASAPRGPRLRIPRMHRMVNRRNDDLPPRGQPRRRTRKPGRRNLLRLTRPPRGAFLSLRQTRGVPRRRAAPLATGQLGALRRGCTT